MVLAYVAALVAPRHAPRVLLLALAANLWLAGWWVVAAVAVAAVALPLGLASAAIVAAYAAVLWLDPAAIALSPFGPSQAGRFYGLSNLLATMLLLPALLGAALLGRAGVAVGVLAVVAAGASGLGADGGGLLVLLAAYAVLALRLGGNGVTSRRAALVGGAALACGALLVGADAMLGGSSHVIDALGDGPGALGGDLGDRLEIGARRVLGGPGPALAAASSLAVLGWVATRRPRVSLVDAALVGIVVSLLVNDTPTDVLAVGAAITVVLYRWNGSSPATATGLFRLRAMRRSVLGLLVLLAAVALVATGCSEGEVTATPETVVGEIPTTGGEGRVCRGGVRARGRRRRRQGPSSPEPPAAAAATRSRTQVRPAPLARCSTTRNRRSIAQRRSSPTAKAGCPRSAATSPIRRSPTCRSTSPTATG